LLLFLGIDYRGYLMNRVTIEGMNKLNIWLRWALGVFGLGLMISLSTTALVNAVIAGSLVSSPAMWWGVMAGVVLSWLCPVAGIILAVRGLLMLVKK
jgi:hypothetical protein